MSKSQPTSREPRRDSSSEREPDTARTYERAKPEKESGMGRLEDDQENPDEAVPRPDEAIRAVRNARTPREDVE